MRYDMNHYFLARKITRKRLYQFLRPYKTKKTVLDAGCGDSVYKGLFPNCISIDMDANRNPDIVADICDLHMFQDSSFDCVLCTEILEHCKEPQKAVDELMRVLKPGGKLLLSTRFIYPMHDTPNDYFRFTKYGLKYLFRDYTILRLEKEATTMETIGILYQRIAFQSNMIPFYRFLLFLKADFLRFYDTLIRNQYGNLRHDNMQEDIIVSGYYLSATKEGISR